MHRLLRIGLIVALLAVLGGWVGGAQGVSAQGTTYTDTMDASSTQLLSTESPDVAKYLYSYQNNQFIMQMLQPGLSGDLLAFTAVPDLTDSSVAVDFAIAGDLTGKYAFVGCRGGDQNTGYIFEVHPDTGQANLWRFDPDDATNLGTATDTSVVNVGSGNNRIEIRCQGSTITGLANGTQLLTAQDTTFVAGDSFIGTGKSNATSDTLLTGFDNLTVTDLGATAAQPTQAPVQPTTQAPAQPTQAGGFPTAIPAQPTEQGGVSTGASDTTLTDPRVDPDGTLSDAFVISLLATPAAGPLQANDNLATSDFKYLSSGANLSDFYTSLSYVTPPATPAGSWTVGFAFWYDAQGNSYDVFIQAKNGAAKWGFGQQTAAGYDILQSGDLAAGAIDYTPGATNYLGLVVTQGLALLTGNDLELAATIDMAGATGTGDVQAEVGFLADDTTTTATLPVALSSFSVWDLSPAAVAAFFADVATTPPAEPTQAAGFPTAIPAQPTQAPLQPTQAPALPTQAPVQPTQAGAAPTVASSTGVDPMLTQVFNQERATAMATAPLFTSASGVLPQTTTGFGYTPAGVAVADFYATVTFVNPTDLSTRSDIGIGFRDLNDNTEFRFVLRSDSEWALAQGTGSPLVQGTATNFDATPGASNTLEIVAHGSTGLIALNGVVIQQVDLSANLNAGDVYIASGMYASDTVDGRQVPYSNFQVYQLTA
ncbi:MAG TPA: hypothetical protein VFP05_17245 [Thermomicrobiales bacterium]|nr:hypothetical protein [Thermomicrobiales bacterium]